MSYYDRGIKLSPPPSKMSYYILNSLLKTTKENQNKR